MARSKKRERAPNAQDVPGSEEQARRANEETDEGLFIEDPSRPFWAAKKLSPHRAVRLHAWINVVLADVVEAIGSINFNDLAGMNWTDIVGKAICVLSEDNYFEILSIASGHARQEIEAKEEEFDYYDAWQCVADFVKLNRLEDVLKNFFLPVLNQVLAKTQKAKPSA